MFIAEYLLEACYFFYFFNIGCYGWLLSTRNGACRLVAGFTPRRFGFNLSSITCVVRKVALEKVFSEKFGLPPS
jgi:hypothetical protein